MPPQVPSHRTCQTFHGLAVMLLTSYAILKPRSSMSCLAYPMGVAQHRNNQNSLLQASARFQVAVPEMS